MKRAFLSTFSGVSVPHSEDSRCLLQLLSQAACFTTAALKQQITRHLHVMVELRAESLCSYASAPSLTFRQEGQLHCDVYVQGSAGKVAKSFILFRNKPEIYQKWSIT